MCFICSRLREFAALLPNFPVSIEFGDQVSAQGTLNGQWRAFVCQGEFYSGIGIFEPEGVIGTILVTRSLAATIAGSTPGATP
jgi:hypothetical protein